MSNPEVFEDTFNLLCHDLLGQGVHRRVFSCRLRPDLVVKVEDNGDASHRSFANVREFDFWGYWRDYKKVADWLAPCEYLSPDGRIMLQKRADPIPSSFTLPENLPAFLTDHKKENFGIIDGRLVCLDYASVIHTPFTKLKKVYWT